MKTCGHKHTYGVCVDEATETIPLADVQAVNHHWATLSTESPVATHRTATDLCEVHARNVRVVADNLRANR